MEKLNKGSRRSSQLNSEKTKTSGLQYSADTLVQVQQSNKTVDKESVLSDDVVSENEQMQQKFIQNKNIILRDF